MVARYDVGIVVRVNDDVDIIITFLELAVLKFQKTVFK